MMPMVRPLVLPGAELQSLRQRLGLTQREAAQLIGVELRSYQRWEGEERAVPPPVQRLVYLMVENPIVVSWLADFSRSVLEKFQ